MKKTLALFYFVLFSFISFAQEAEEAIGASEDIEEWSYETKAVLLIGFAILCIFFAVRTFRGKPEA